MPMPAALAIRGTLVQCEASPSTADEEWLKVREGWCVGVDGDGIICFSGPAEEAGNILAEATKVLELKKNQFLCPGFIDTHIHAPQYSYTGTATDKPLMEWLQDYTFPAERDLADVDKAKLVYEKVVSRTLRNGTTTAMYFGTLHRISSEELASVCYKLGQRALVGKVSMDRNGQQGYQENDTKAALEDADLFIRNLQASPGGQCGMIMPVLTPRFIPTCTPDLLRGLGELAKRYNCHVQSHISESLDEVEFTASLHPNEGSDTQIFDTAGLLRKGAMMAHGVHLSDEDVNILQTRGAAIAHCPLSNFYFAHGYLPVAKLLKNNVLIGLGTDVAGGYSPSMLNAMRTAVIASKAGAIQERTAHLEGDHMIDYRHAFYLATLGGAKALGLDHIIGEIAVNKEFDALILDADSQDNIDIFPSDSPSDVFQKICTLGDDRNISYVFTPTLLKSFLATTST